MIDGKPSRREIRELRRDNARWPTQMVVVPRELWPHEIQGVSASTESKRLEVFRDRDFLVQVFQEDLGILRLSICRTDWDENKGRLKDGISWDDLQRIKDECGFVNLQAVEIYPEKSAIVNVANMRHLWVLPIRLPFSWGKPADPAAAPALEAESV